MACCRAVIQPLDDLAHRFPVSVKGVLVHEGHVVLVGNSRGEWELPAASSSRARPRGMRRARDSEELALHVTVGPPRRLGLRNHRRDPGARGDLRVPRRALPDPLVSPEGRPVGRFPLAALATLPLPGGYRRAIEAWFASGARWA
jgi:hypothetical protein